jgi:Cu2+-exporting ATPase
MWGDHIVKAGNCHWLNVETHPTVEALLRTRATGLVVTIDGVLVAVFALANPLRPESDTVIDALLAQGLKVSIVSGDEESAVHFIADSLKVPSANVMARCSPADKQKYILEALGPNQENTVIFCGDGTNDAVALKQATIGIHMSDGTDVAKSAANVVLVRPDLRGILLLLHLAKTSKRRIQFNFTWSIIYNLVAITFAAGAWVKVSLPPEFAALGELVSVLPVIAIAIQLKFVNFRYEKSSV